MKSIPVSHLTYSHDHDCCPEKNSSPSLTTPDQSLSLREMLKRYSRGQSVPTFEPVYDGEDQMPDVSTMSKIELEELRQDVLGEIIHQRHILNRERKNKIRELRDNSRNAETAQDAKILLDQATALETDNEKDSPV